MKLNERPDDFDERHAHLRNMSDDDLHAYFWKLAGQIVEPLITEARTHTSPSIERSVLLRMGFSSIEAKALVQRMTDAGLLAQGAGKLILALSERKGSSVRETGEALIEGRWWEELRP